MTCDAVQAPLILVVEDDRSSRVVLAQILIGKGYRVDQARDVADGIGMIGAQAVAILDLMLPDGLGLAVLEAIRQKQPLMRVAFFTATSDGELEAQCRLRADAVFIKPLGADRMFQWIEEVAPIDRTTEAA